MQWMYSPWGISACSVSFWRVTKCLPPQDATVLQFPPRLRLLCRWWLCPDRLNFSSPWTPPPHSLTITTFSSSDRSSLHKPPGNFPFICSPQSVREGSPCSPTFNLPVSNTPGWHLEQVGGRLVPSSVLFGGMAYQAVPLYAPHMTLRGPLMR